MLFSLCEPPYVKYCLIKTSFYQVKTSCKIEQLISSPLVEQKQTSRSGTRHNSLFYSVLLYITRRVLEFLNLFLSIYIQILWKCQYEMASLCWSDERCCLTLYPVSVLNSRYLGKRKRANEMLIDWWSMIPQWFETQGFPAYGCFLPI